jgi:hypothetical protein
MRNTLSTDLWLIADGPFIAASNRAPGDTLRVCLCPKVAAEKKNAWCRGQTLRDVDYE